MRDCNHYETLISAWQDSELDRGGQVEMMDHLSLCGGCRDFYRAARGLDGLVAALGARAAGVAPSPELWRRIEQSARARESWWGRGTEPWKRRFAMPAGAAAAAAAAALLIVFGLPAERGGNPVDFRTAVTEIRLGGNPAGMDDERFVELTKQVLGADRKYRTAFYEVMKRVVQDTQGNEPSRDLLSPRGERGEETESQSTARGRS